MFVSELTATRSQFLQVYLPSFLQSVCSGFQLVHRELNSGMMLRLGLMSKRYRCDLFKASCCFGIC